MYFFYLHSFPWCPSGLAWATLLSVINPCVWKLNQEYPVHTDASAGHEELGKEATQAAPGKKGFCVKSKVPSWARFPPTCQGLVLLRKNVRGQEPCKVSNQGRRWGRWVWRSSEKAWTSLPDADSFGDSCRLPLTVPGGSGQGLSRCDLHWPWQS